MQIRNLLIAATALVAASPAMGASSPSYWTVGTGVSFSRGDYGELTDTKVLAVPFSLTYRTSGWKFRASLPFIRISGPALILQTPEGRDAGGNLGGSDGGSNSGSGSDNSGHGSDNSGSGSGSGSGGGDVVDDDDDGDSGGGGGSDDNDDRGARSGIGDLTLAATYSAELGHGFYIEPTLKVKVPTASRAKRIGTGKADFTPSVDLVKQIDKLTFYVSGRRKFAGKPSGSNIRDTWGGSGGFSLRATRLLAMGLDYDRQQSSVSGRGSSSEVTGWSNIRLNRRMGLTLSATKGLNRNSADYAVAMALALRL